MNHRGGSTKMQMDLGCVWSPVEEEVHSPLTHRSTRIVQMEQKQFPRTPRTTDSVSVAHFCDAVCSIASPPVSFHSKLRLLVSALQMVTDANVIAQSFLIWGPYLTPPLQ